MEYYSAIKKNTFESILMWGLKPEPTIQSEVSQKENPKRRGSLRFLPPLEVRPSSVAPDPAESRGAPPPPQDPSPLRGTLGSSLRSPAEGEGRSEERRVGKVLGSDSCRRKRKEAGLQREKISCNVVSIEASAVQEQRWESLQRCPVWRRRTGPLYLCVHQSLRYGHLWERDVILGKAEIPRLLPGT